MQSQDTITINSSTKNLAKVRAFIERKSAELGFEQNEVNQIILAVDEACTNVIKYSHSYDDTNLISITTERTGNDFKIILKYTGKSFNPNVIATPDMIEYFKNFKVGGLGIPMMKKFMNRIEYRHNSSDGNSLTLVKTIS